jgi:3-dehydroquinate dehydratase II
MSTTRNRVAVLHGVNFDILDRRDPEVYGGLSLSELEQRIGDWAHGLGLEPIFFQTNHEGEFVEYLHRLPDLADSSLINAGAWSHYSRAIADALDVARLPAVEVHLYDVENRDDWRRDSVFDGFEWSLCMGAGYSPFFYRLSLYGASGGRSGGLGGDHGGRRLAGRDRQAAAWQVRLRG